MIFYRLITADGIKSEIREMATLNSSLCFALRHKIKISEPVEAQSSLPDEPIFKCREYTPVRYTTVQFVEYEEI